MKIKSLHISAFGGIKNLDLDLNNPFNIIYGDNENGKTTIMTFIRLMFYGTERSNKNLRSKYSPWDGSAMAGSIDFENEGRNYRIERIFGNSNTSDKVTLIDVGLGERSSVKHDIGATLLGITAAAFERSIFIGQFGFPENDSLAEGELNGKLSNIASTGDETVSYDAIYKRLEDARYELSSRSARSGIYDKNMKAIEELEKELEKSNVASEKIEMAKQKTLEIGEEIKKMQESAMALKAKIDSENDFRNAEKLQELLELKSRLDELSKSLTLENGTVADEMFVRKVEFCLSKIDGIKAKIDSKQNEISIISCNLSLALNPVSNASDEKKAELEEKISALESENNDIAEKITQYEQTPEKKAGILPFVLAAVFGVAGAACFLWKIFAAVGGLALAVVFICIGLVSANKAKNKNEKRKSDILDLKLKQNNLVSLIASEKANLTAVTAALNSNSAMIEGQKEQLKKGEEELLALNESLESENDILIRLFSALKPIDDTEQIAQLLSEIKDSAAKQKELKQNINYILKDVGNISYDEAREKLACLKTDSTIDFEAAKQEYENLLQQITDQKTLAASIMAEVKTLAHSTRSSENIKTEISALTQKAQAQKEYLDCLDVALQVLTDSYAQVRESYGSVLEKKASEIFAGLTNSKYKNMSISKSFDISVEQTDVFGAKDLDYLSSGTQDQAYLSLRLALSALMTDGKDSLPIILDDALAQYDDTRTKAALEFLNSYSKNGQIIFFTCHNSVVDAAKDFGVNQITL